MMTLQQAAQALGVARQGVDAQFDGVSTDSRTLVAGELFVALRGDNFDGHQYVVEVLARGAAGAIVGADFARAHPELPLIAVGDTRLALGALAAYWRGLFDIPVIGVTGSNGKTTVKEMCAAILRKHCGAEGDSVLATQGNFNNDIGLPLTLLRLRASHRAAVIEMGMNHRGEIDYLSRLTAPSVALVNNAQRAHLAGLGSLHEVALAKGEIFAGLSDDGVAVINADDAHAPLWRELAQGRRQLSFGLNPDAAQRADYCVDICGKFVPHGFGGALTLTTPQGVFEASLGVPGRHNAGNACAAAAAALAAGAAPAAVVQGLAAFTGVKGRLQRCAGLKGALIVNDSYNANPDSMRAAIDVVATVPGKRIVVMGDMGEVGAAAGQVHDEIGGYARSHGIDRLLCLGEWSAAAAHNFGQGGQHFQQLDDLLAVLKTALDEHTTVLVKGSRFMRMERVVAAISAIADSDLGVAVEREGRHHAP